LRRAPSMNATYSRTLTRKTSLLRKIVPIARRSSFAKRIIYNSLVLQTQPCELPLNDARAPKWSGDNEVSRGNCLPHDPTRIDLLFTMSEITQLTVYPDW